MPADPRQQAGQSKEAMTSTPRPGATRRWGMVTYEAKGSREAGTQHQRWMI